MVSDWFNSFLVFFPPKFSIQWLPDSSRFHWLRCWWSGELRKSFVFNQVQRAELRYKLSQPTPDLQDTIKVPDQRVSLWPTVPTHCISSLLSPLLLVLLIYLICLPSQLPPSLPGWRWFPKMSGSLLLGNPVTNFTPYNIQHSTNWGSLFSLSWILQWEYGWGDFHIQPLQYEIWYI